MGNNMRTGTSFLTLLTFSILLVGCRSQHCEIEPRICSPAPKACGNSLLGFPDFTREESRESWSKEAFIARSFAQEFDLYRAITGYKRALFLLPPAYIERRQQIEYGIILCYYLGEKYNDVVETFEKSSLIDFPPSFPARTDLLIILYDAYQKIGCPEKADRIQTIICEGDSHLSERLQLSQALLKGNLAYLVDSQYEEPAVECLVNTYYSQEKSVQRAEFLNAILPGAGYYYVGQKQTALTSFVINGLFTAAAYYFFDQGNIAAGLIIASLEGGWYFGGIKGAGIAAREYNERLYENLAREALCKQQLFPILMIQHTF